MIMIASILLEAIVPKMEYAGLVQVTTIVFACTLLISPEALVTSPVVCVALVTQTVNALKMDVTIVELMGPVLIVLRRLIAALRTWVVNLIVIMSLVSAFLDARWMNIVPMNAYPNVTWILIVVLNVYLIMTVLLHHGSMRHETRPLAQAFTTNVLQDVLLMLIVHRMHKLVLSTLENVYNANLMLIVVDPNQLAILLWDNVWNVQVIPTVLNLDYQLVISPDKSAPSVLMTVTVMVKY